MAKKKTKKTLPEQVLDQHGIAYTPWSLNVLDQSDQQREDTLSALGLTSADIYKTLALEGDKTGPIVAVIPITEHLAMKKLAAASGNKKVHMLPLKVLQKTTGYVHGANNPVGIWQNKKFPIYIDASAKDRDYFLVSAGELGRSDQIAPADVAQLVGAKFTDMLE